MHKTLYRGFALALGMCVGLAPILPSFAAGSLEPYSIEEAFGYDQTAAAQAYFRLPFNGGLKTVRSEPQAGLALSVQARGSMRGGLMIHQQRPLELSIGLSGTPAFKMNGLTPMQYEQILAASGESGGGGLPWWGWALIGAGALIAGVLIFVDDCDVGGIGPDCVDNSN